MKILSAQKDKKNTPTLWIVKSIEKTVFLYSRIVYYVYFYILMFFILHYINNH